MDTLSQQQRSKTMRAVKSEDTTPEKTIRSFLFKRGFRFRLHVKSLPGKPDIVLPKFKTIIDVRGCFWHQHQSPTCTRNKTPGDHKQYWSEKFRKNVERDAKREQEWRALGWTVIVVWECEAALESVLKNKLAPLLERRPKNLTVNP